MHTNLSYLQHFMIFFFNDTATTAIYTLSLHDALPIWPDRLAERLADHHWAVVNAGISGNRLLRYGAGPRSEEHTSELQSRGHLVCRLLLEKKKPPKQRFLMNKQKKQKVHTT